MISIALVLLLILGVNQIFTYTTQAVGAGQAVSAAIRDSRAAQSQFDSDFGAMVSPGGGINDSASLVISSMALYGFRDAVDLKSDRDGIASTIDLNNNKIEGEQNVPGEIIPSYRYNYRNHRMDVLSFFARNLYHRQTGNPGVFVDNMAGQEAWIWYGHLWLPSNTGYYLADGVTPTYPGFGNPAQNPNNSFATQLVLGRVAILLNEKNSATATQNPNGISDPTQVPQWFYDRVSTPTAADLSPLTYGSTLNTNGAPSNNTSDPGSYTGANLLYGGRVDLASTSISNFRQKMQNVIAAGSTNPYYYWWDTMMDGNGYASRFQCNPFVAKPMQAVDMAHASPYFLGGCSQFIVEYAGDYLVQDNTTTDTSYGQVQKAGQDGQIDYILIGTGAQQRKQIIWYGQPRNTSGLAGLNLGNGDVAPLDTWIRAYGLTNPYSFEKVLPVYGSAQSVDPSTLQAGPGRATYSSTFISPTNPINAQYLCAWSCGAPSGSPPADVKPKLIRITLTLDDPTGRLPEGQTYQYVYAVP